MKKLVSTVFVGIILLSMFIMPVYATSDTNVFEWKYYDNIIEYFAEFDEYERASIDSCYDEIYYHYSFDDADEPDWALVFCGFDPAPTEMKYGTLVGKRILSVVGGGCTGFVDGYGVYVKEMDSFIPLRQSYLDQIAELCPGFIEAIEENEIGQQFGDVNNDSKLSVTDATYIQRYLAEIYDFIQTYFSVHLDGGRDVISVADYDRDGKTTVLDATAIQRKLAELDEPVVNDEMVITQEEAFNYSNLPEMPEDSEELDFELLYTYEDFMKYPSSYFENYYDDIYAIIKTKEQYDEVLNIYNDEFDEKFFETKWLFVSVRRTSNLRMLAPVTDMRIKDGTLYFVANEYYPDLDVVQPVESFFTSISAVEKSSLKDVTNIQRVKKLDEPVVNDDLVIVTIPQQLQSMPQKAVALPFEEKYNEDQLYHRIYRDNMLGFADTFAIVKSNEQYYSLFNEDAPVFEDEFFESKWLLVSFLSMDGNGGYIQPVNIAKSGNTLYSQSDVFVSASTTPPPPIMRWSLSMIAIDKEYLANVTDIVRIE